jgi:hypothetical protein
MSDSPPPIVDDADTKHNESNDLFFSTIADSSDSVSRIYMDVEDFQSRICPCTRAKNTSAGV